MQTPIKVVWIRNDLRISDHPALYTAMSRAGETWALYVWDGNDSSPAAPGAASRSWLHHSLQRFSELCHKIGCPFTIRTGDALEVLPAFASELGANELHWNRSYEPEQSRQDQLMKQRLAKRGVTVFTHHGNLLMEPWEISNREGNPFQVFTPFWKTHQASFIRTKPLPSPQTRPMPERKVSTCSIRELKLQPEPSWDSAFWEHHTPGPTGAWKALRRFIRDVAANYDRGRDVPGIEGTSKLSAHLHFGEISALEVLHEVRTKLPESPSRTRFEAELGWREFNHHLLYHHPEATRCPIKPAFEAFPWRESGERLRLWQRGQTGIPIVDAGMRELWHSGWMHNRVRMITASFLVKNLMIHWKHGAEWFHNTLLDADLANNTMGWQWVAGCGADAAPFFRIFNPVTQSAKFDPEGTYLRRWIPEIRMLTKEQIHAPWMHPDRLKQCSYPRPCVSLLESRHQALEAYRKLNAARMPLTLGSSASNGKPKESALFHPNQTNWHDSW
jgi:deoxyribodipyrimidine photo-lyase